MLQLVNSGIDRADGDEMRRAFMLFKNWQTTFFTGGFLFLSLLALNCPAVEIIQDNAISNAPPVINWRSPENVFVFREIGTQVFSLRAYDPENDDLTYAWTLDGGAIGDDLPSYTYTTDWLAGRHVIACYVSDATHDRQVYATWDINATYDPIVITTVNLPLATEMVPYQQQMEAAEGARPYSWARLPPIVTWGHENYADNLPGLTTTTNIACMSGSYSYALALKNDGTVEGFGNDSEGQATPPSGLKNIVDVYAGTTHGLALQADGTVVAWGNNIYGQCDVPADLTDAIDISASSTASMALKSDGTLIMWGDDTYPIPDALENVTAISSGAYHHLALKTDGTVVDWGKHETFGVAKPVLQGIVAIAARGTHSLALRSNGTVAAWGSNGNTESEIPAGLQDVVAIDGSWAGSIALKSDGTIVGWGSPNFNVPERFSYCGDFVGIASTGNLAIGIRGDKSQLPKGLALSEDGVISGTPIEATTNTVCFVAEDALQADTYTNITVVVQSNINQRPVIDTAVPAAGALSIVEASTNTFTVSASDPEGADLDYRWLWDGVEVGSNASVCDLTPDWGSMGSHLLQCFVSDDLWDNIVQVRWSVEVTDLPIEISTTLLPLGTELISYQAQLESIQGSAPYTWAALPSYYAWGQDEEPTNHLDNIVAIAANAGHTLALLDDGTVTSWKSYENATYAEVPEGLSDVTAIAAGKYHSLALKADGTVVAWGINNDLQCEVPAGLSNVVQVACGDTHSLALKADGTISAWGEVMYGSAGVPEGMTNITAIAAGGTYSFALNADGVASTFSIGDRIFKTKTNVKAISCGESFGLVIHNDSTVSMWGSSWDSKLLEGIDQVEAIACGLKHCLILKTDGTVLALGNTSYGACDIPEVMYDVSSVFAGGYKNYVLRSPSSALPRGLQCSEDGIISGTPYDASTNRVHFVVEDASGLRSDTWLTLAVGENSNRPPQLLSHSPVSTEITLNEVQEQLFSVTASDPESTTLSYRWTLNGSNLQQYGPNYIFSTLWGGAGTYQLCCYISDDLWSERVSQTWNITVEDLTLSILNDSLPVGREMEPYHLQLAATNGIAPYRWRTQPQTITWGTADQQARITIPDGIEIAAISTKRYSSLALTAQGEVIALADNLTPPVITNAIAVAAGGSHGLALLNDGTIQGFGYDRDSQISGGSHISNAVAIACGTDHSLAVLADGTVEAWGSNAGYACDVPDGLADVVAVSAAYRHSLALKSDGTVVAWGDVTQPPTGLTNVVAISACSHHCMALKADGTVEVWGNSFATDYMNIGLARDLTDIVAVQACYYHSIALKSDGTVISWGSSTYAPPPYGLKATMISGGFHFSIALRQAHTALPRGLTCSSDGIISGAPLEAGTNLVTIIVDDTPFGESTTNSTSWKTLELVVESNQNLPPELTGSEPAQGWLEVEETGSQTFVVNVRDPEGQALTYQWLLDGQPTGQNNPRYDFEAGIGANQKYELICKVSDDLWQDIAIANWNITTTDLPLDIDTDALPAGVTVEPYSFQLTASNGAEPFIWSAQPQIIGWGVFAQAALRDMQNVKTAVIDPRSRNTAVVKNNGDVYIIDTSSVAEVEEWKNVIDVDYTFGNLIALMSDGKVASRGGIVAPADLTGATQIAAGRYYGIALKDDGTVQTWGDADNTPAIPDGLDDVIQIDSGYWHCLALRADGTVVGWGSNSNKQLDIPAGLADVVAIHANASSSLALKSDGTVVQWGSVTANYPIPENLTDVTAIYGGLYTTFALRTNGDLIGWGPNDTYHQSESQYGMREVVTASSCDVFSLAVQPANHALPEGMSCSSEGLITGRPTMAGIFEVKFFVTDAQGFQFEKVLSITVSDNPNQPPIIESVTPSQDKLVLKENDIQNFNVNAEDPDGEALTYRWMLDGENARISSSNFVWATGWEDIGQHSLKCYVEDSHWTNYVYRQWTITVEDQPLEIVNKTLAIGLEQDTYHDLLQATNGAAPYTWEIEPQILGIGSYAGDVPSNLPEVTKIAAGGYHTLALHTDGTISAWGSNNQGQCDIPQGLSNVVELAGGWGHSIALKADGTVEAWGYNPYGSATVPRGLVDVVSISTVSHHNLALKSDGTVVGWGMETYGRGVVPDNLRTATAVAAGQAESYALHADGTVTGWSDDYPDLSGVKKLADIVDIAAGDAYLLAVTSEGDLWSAGRYSVYDTGISNVVKIATSLDNMAVMLMDGRILYKNTYASEWNEYSSSTDEIIDFSIRNNLLELLRTDKTMLPPGISFSSDGILSGTPQIATTNNLKFIVRDARNATTNKTLQLVVETNNNWKPVIRSSAPHSAISIKETLQRSFHVEADDPEGALLTYQWELNGQPVGENSAYFTMQTDWGDAGAYQLRCYISDDYWEKRVHAEWTIQVTDDNDEDGLPNGVEVDLGRDPENPADEILYPMFGSVLTIKHSPISGATVSLVGKSGTVYHQVDTDASGAYRFDNISKGHYYIKAEAANYADEWYPNTPYHEYAETYEDYDRLYDDYLANAYINSSTPGQITFYLEDGQSPALVEVLSTPPGAAIFLDCQTTRKRTPAIIEIGDTRRFDQFGNLLAAHKITVVPLEGSLTVAPQEVAATEADKIQIRFDSNTQETGAINVTTYPAGAKVFLDKTDVAAGITPLSVNQLEPGVHTVMLEMQGHLQARPIDAIVQAGKTNEIAVTLTPDTQPISMGALVISIPPAARIFMNYLPTYKKTDSGIDGLDPAQFSGSGWASTAHSVMYRKEGFLPTAPHYVAEAIGGRDFVVANLLPCPQTIRDDDGNGLPDQWEDSYQLRIEEPSESGLADDPDRDGVTNRDEYRAGTNPLDPNSALVIEGVNIEQTTSNLIVTFDSVPGMQYRILYTDNLLSDWDKRSPVITARSYSTQIAIPTSETGLGYSFKVILTGR